MKLTVTFSLMLNFMLFSYDFLNADEIAIPPSLERYVTSEDDSFAWEKLHSMKTELGIVYQLKLVSQTWHDIDVRRKGKLGFSKRPVQSL